MLSIKLTGHIRDCTIYFFKKQDLNSWVMLRFIAVLIPIVFILLKITSGKWLESSALSVAVGLMPEMLPVWVAL